MRIHCEPPWNEIAPSHITGPAGAGRPVIATGHQAWHWHPGILAKYAAAAGLARRHGGSALQVVVDHDVVDPLRVDLPVREGDRLRLETLRLGVVPAGVPPVSLPAIDAGLALARIDEARDRLGAGIAVPLDWLRAAWEATVGEPHADLAQQVSAVVDRMMAPLGVAIPKVFSSALLATPAGEAILRRMTGDARACALAYNQALAPVDGAEGHEPASPLMIEAGRVELPVWLLAPGAKRARVYAQSDGTAASAVRSHPPSGPEPAGPARLVDQEGTPIPWGWSTTTSPSGSPAPRVRLAPRALLLTALMRSSACDLFIHGKGGAVYDQAMQRWWAEWTGTPLAPVAVVSADVFLDLDLPVHSPEELARARWRVHHLPHNLDRELGLESPAGKRKRELLAHMDDDRDRRRRAAAFAELHAINARLAAERPDLIAAAGAEAERAKAGVLNRELAGRRDWCFALHPRGPMRELAAAFT